MNDEQLLKRIKIWILICGILSVVFYLLHDIIGAMHYPGYKWMEQAVSDLTATDAQSFAIAKGYTTIHGIFSHSYMCMLLQHWLYCFLSYLS